MKRKRPALFKRRHFEDEIIVLCVRWYLRYPLSFRQLEEIMSERNLSVDHVTIWRWVQRYSPELNSRCRPAFTEHQSILASRRDILPGGGQVDLFISGGRFGRRHHRFFLEREARRGFGQAFHGESFALTRPSSTTSDQRGPESVLPEGHRGVENNRRTQSTVSLSTSTVLE